MKQKIETLAKRFIKIHSIPGDSTALEKILAIAVEELKGYTVEQFEQNGVKSALIYNRKQRPEKFTVLLNAHLDVIAGKESQYSPTKKGDRLYGVGSMDMKANAACMILAFNEIADKVTYPLGLQLTTDEETGGYNGTKYQKEEGIHTDFILAGEPTNFDIVYKAKGILQMRITVKGKTAHSAYPWRGDNVIGKMHTFLTTLNKRFPTPSQEFMGTTVSVSKIDTTNEALNKIPDVGYIWLDIRFVPEESKEIVEIIRKMLPDGCGVTIFANEFAMHTDKNNSFIQLLKKTTEGILSKPITLRGAHGTSDVRHFTQSGAAGIEFGPIGGDIGGDNEWVSISSLDIYYNILVSFLLLIP